MKLQNIGDADISPHEILWRKYPLKRKNKMKINLQQTYLSATDRKEQIERELEILEAKLKTPERTVEDLVHHIELLKEYRLYK